MLLPAVLARLLLPMAALVSVYFLLRGHNAPGGGFVVASSWRRRSSFSTWSAAPAGSSQRLRIHPQLWIALGLLAAPRQASELCSRRGRS